VLISVLFDPTCLEDAEGCGAAPSLRRLFRNADEETCHGDERFLGCVEVIVVGDLQSHLCGEIFRVRICIGKDRQRSSTACVCKYRLWSEHHP